MVRVVNNKSGVPIYQKIRDQLARDIKSGELNFGDRLPSERTLAEEFGSARETVREALFMLEGEGFISRRKNRGWYVDTNRLRYDPTNHVNIFKMIEQSGGVPSDISFGWRETKASLSIARMMECEPGTALLSHSTVVIWNDRKIVYDENYLLKSYFPEFPASEFKSPITDFLTERFNVITTQVGFRARPTLLYGVVADSLEVTPGTPGIFLTRIKAHEGKIMQVDRDFWVSGALEIVTGQFPQREIMAKFQSN